MSANGIVDRVLLVSDCPGELAFFSNNAVIAADMLTANRTLVADLLNAENALEYLAAYCLRVGRPIDYALVNFDRWLKPSTDRRALTLYSPREAERHVRIGHKQVGDPIYVAADGWLTVWTWPR